MVWDSGDWNPKLPGQKTTNNLPLVDLQSELAHKTKLEMGVKVGCLEIPDSKICLECLEKNTTNIHQQFITHNLVT